MNNSNKLLVISTYSPKGQLHGNKFSAVAGYTKNTLTHLPNYAELDVVVLADILENKVEIYREGPIKVDRFWKRNAPFLYYSLLKKIFDYSEYQKILFEFEFGMFGGNKILIMLLPIFIAILRIFNKEVITVSHGVILTASEVSGQLGLQKNNLKTMVMDKALYCLYFLTCLFSNKIIVFESYLKEKLADEVGFRNKIYWIPHGVEKSYANKEISKLEARKELGLEEKDFIILNFGFVIWYKGSDWLIKTVGDLIAENKFENSKIKLIVAGGFSKIHEKDPVYSKYCQDITKHVNDSKDKIILTGFIKEEDIMLYFKAADLVVMPYRVLISASGPFSFILKNGSPFILSEALEGYQLSADFRDSMIKLDINPNDIFFDMEKDSFKDLILKYENDPSLANKSEALAKNLYRMRLWSEVGKMYKKVLFD